MNTPRAFSASYSDFKLVKTRGCVQIIFEVPVEQSTAVLKILGGMPTPAEEKWFGIAPLDPKLMAEEKKAAPVVSLLGPPKGSRAHPKQAWNDMAPSQQAGLLCNDPAFWRYVREEREVDVHDAQAAANFVRNYCGVKSRSEIVSGVPLNDWERLLRQYRAWQRLPEHVA